MAFDQSTRNRLQKFVNDARNLLTEEFTRQLQATYGLDPKAGTVAAVDSLTHLDDRQRQTATFCATPWRITWPQPRQRREGPNKQALESHRARAGLYRAQPLGRLAHGRSAWLVVGIDRQRLQLQRLSAL